jgi:hypothetical protein
MRRALVLTLAATAGLMILLLHVNARNEADARGMAMARMAGGLVVIWVYLGGAVMWLARDHARALLLRSPLGWRTTFVLACTALACLEEAVTVSMTNLAPVFGVPVGVAYITASTNWLDVVLFHSVVVFVPMFIALAVILGRWDLSPFAVFLSYGVVGTLGEAIFAADPTVLLAFPMWVFVFGLMVFLPAYGLPPAKSRGARPARWHHALLAAPLTLLLALPMILPLFWLIVVVLEHPRTHF